MFKKLHHFLKTNKKNLRSRHPISYYFLFSDLFIQKTLFRQTIRKYLKELNGAVVDIGCGNQPYKRFIKYSKYIGVEYNKECQPDVVADAVALPFTSESFNSALCTEVIEHIQEPEQVLKEIYRVLKPGSKLVISAPMSWGLHYEPRDFYRFTNYGLKYLLEKNGFKVILTERVGGAFSLAGQRVIEALHRAISRKLNFLPGLLRLFIIQLFISIPLTLVFFPLAKIFDRIDKSDAICWVVLAVKPD